MKTTPKQRDEWRRDGFTLWSQRIAVLDDLDEAIAARKAAERSLATYVLASDSWDACREENLALHAEVARLTGDDESVAATLARTMAEVALLREWRAAVRTIPAFHLTAKLAELDRRLAALASSAPAVATPVDDRVRSES